jgi:hypothetical protein
MMGKRLSLEGRRFGRLLVLASAGTRIYGKSQRRSIWRCLCVCGKETIIPSSSLTHKLTKSCGCLRSETTTKKNELSSGVPVTHGMTGTPEYQAYKDARRRCTKKTCPRWEDYGGRGIKFLFSGFEEFFNELGRRTSPYHSLDRINNDGNYEVGNVRWATPEEQRLNQREV